MKSHLIFIGAPGSGKGTYASRLESRLDVPAIATGDILREMAQRETNNARKLRRYMSNGELVPDRIVIEILRERLARDDCRRGFLLDGFPRTIEQAETLEKMTTINAIIHLVVPEWVVVERLSSRRICKDCGAVYNLRFLKPKKAGVCDKCGGPLYQRDDDRPEIISQRLQTYNKDTAPIIDYYSKKDYYLQVDAGDDIDRVKETITRVLGG